MHPFRSLIKQGRNPDVKTCSMESEGVSLGRTAFNHSPPLSLCSKVGKLKDISTSCNKALAAVEAVLSGTGIIVVRFLLRKNKDRDER